MQAVILAAGKSTRTYPLTLTRPKPLLAVGGQTILAHNLRAMRGLVEEVIVVVGYKGEMIQEFLGEEFEGMRIKYIEQTNLSGTANALLAAAPHLKGKFLLMYGDDFYGSRNLRDLLEFDNAILAHRVNDPQNFGVLEVEGDRFVRVIEKPQTFVSDLVSIGCFVFSAEIFDVLKEVELSTRGEYEFTDAYNFFARSHEVKVLEAQDYWLPITYPWSLLQANEFFLGQLEGVRATGAQVEDGVKLKGSVCVGEGSVIKSGVYIEGPVMIGKNCVVGPNCYLRAGTCMGDSCHIGQAVEIKNSLIGSGTNVAHLSYVGDSVLGERVNFGAGTLTANLRHDGANVKSLVGEKLIDTGLRKCGVFVGDGAKTGIHTSFYPGVKMDSATTSACGEVVKRNVYAAGK